MVLCRFWDDSCGLCDCVGAISKNEDTLSIKYHNEIVLEDN